jgi:polysaccharide pyruvyl transferase WcaK-like protein
MSARPARVFLVGLYGVQNLGDEAIRAAVDGAAPRFGATLDRFAVRRDSGADGDPRAVRLRGRRWREYLAACGRADRIVLGGGGLLKDEGHGVVQGYGVLLELLLTAAVGRILRKDVRWVGMGVGPIHTRRGGWLIRAIAALTQRRVVRDEGSRAALERLGVRDVEVYADPTFTLPRPPPSRPDGRVLISVRSWFEFEPDRERRWAVLADALLAGAREALGRGYAVHFVPLYWPRDRETAEALAAELPPESVVVRSSPLDWDGLRGELEGARLLVAMRYHAVACALTAGRPAIPVAYEPKVASLAAAAGLPRLGVDDPDLATRLARAVRDELDGDPSAPDVELVERLRAGAEAGLRRSLA